jgi:hypothetical protein
MLRRTSWDSVKQCCLPYRRRMPEQSELYRLVYHHRYELELLWEERFQSQYGVLRDEVLTTLDNYLNCGLLAHVGGRIPISSQTTTLKI